MKINELDFVVITVKLLTMLLQPTFARAPLLSIVVMQGVLPSVTLVASVRAGKGG